MTAHRVLVATLVGARPVRAREQRGRLVGTQCDAVHFRS